MTELSIFDFEGQEIKVKGIGSTDTPEWIAADVGAVLGIDQSTLSRRVAKMPDSWKGMYSIHTLGGQQQMLTVTEPGLYELIFRSDKPAAQRFRVWMFEEVLPSIRRTGSYSHSASEQKVDNQVSQLIGLAQTQVEVINEQQKMLAAALTALHKTTAKDKKQPKWTPRSTSHLLEFAREVGLESQPDGRVFTSDIWQQLRDWYIKTGVLRVEILKGEEKLTWHDLPKKHGNPVKAINQLPRRLCEVFPKLQILRYTGHDTGPNGKSRLGCSYLSGIGYVQKSALPGEDEV
ncbi:BRO family protein [Microcoleus sp. T2B6]|uniref:BRO family protein n=1 Tax=Microcoleus sp. T2B6 TaxID=3055424 RepID=UPI002FD4A834